MRISAVTYIPGSTAVHACDARAKIVVLVAFTAAVFFVGTWAGMALMLAAPCVVLAAARVPARALVAPLGATAVFAALAVAFGAMGAGLASGCFTALRIVALVLGSLAVSLTTSPETLAAAFSSLMNPVRPLRVPVDDMSTALAIAVRFIPVLFAEVGRLRDAQWSRGASFAEGGLVARVRAWSRVLVPLFVGLFRRADALAFAMDARCYGAPGKRRTSLSARAFGVRGVLVTAVGVAACVAVAALL